MANAYRDENSVPTLIGSSNADGFTPVRLYADPTTHRLLVDAAAGVPLFADNETPAGVVNGVNATFTLAFTPSPAASLQLFQNGVLMKAGGVDYTLAVATITFVSAPLTGSILVAWYRH